MASSAESVDDAPSSSEQNPWTCPLCLGPFTRPKLLPCSHTFCEACLRRLMRHHPYSSFSCPICREKIEVPPRGVSAFKTNFYIDEARVKKEKLFCKKHPKPRELELKCLGCDALICLECKYTDHHTHNIEDVQVTVQKEKTALSETNTELNDLVEDLNKHTEDFRKEEQAVRDKRAALKKEILSRHKMMVHAANKCRDEALDSLDTVIATIESQTEIVVSNLQKNLDELKKLQERIDNCLRDEEGVRLLLTAGEIYKDATECKKVVQKLKSNNITTVSRPVLHFWVSADETLTTEQKFLGPVVKMDFAVVKPEVNVKEMFTCLSPKDSRSIEVFSLFPRVDNTVWVTYDPGLRPSNGQPAGRCPERFDVSGRVIESKASIHGRTNFTHTSNGTDIYIVQERGCFYTYAKSRSLLKLKNISQSLACVMRTIVRSENPLETFEEIQFFINCGPHRAFDVDANEIFFAVVEEGQAPDFQRKVLLYQQSEKKPIAAYSPPTQPFQPSDVCFCWLDDRQVLLVADTLNDAIHVVDGQNGRLELLRYLAPGCPLLLQPTALNTDTRGRLWVGCRAGSILLVE